MGHRRKRQREEEESVVVTATHAPNEPAAVVPAPAQQQQQESLLTFSKSCRRRTAPVTSSFLFAPTMFLPQWQRVALSTLRQLHESQAEEHRAATRGRTLQKDLTRYHEDLHRREERLRAQQREARARLGNKLFMAIEKQWSRRGDVFQQLLCVEFDDVKQRHTERRQEDLLREAENLTRSLLDGIFSGTKNHGSHSDGDDSRGIDADEAVADALRNAEMTGGASGPVLESSLSLLDTQNGRRPLRDYQRSALRWMTNLYTKKLNGILADEMGLGKTIQTIALLAYFAEYKNDWGPHLIVVPTTVVLNWKAEFQRWCPGMKVLVYIGTPKERHRLRKGWMGEDALHVCITSYNLLVKDRCVFRRRPWGFLVLDEAHQVKNFMSKKWQSLFDLQAEYRLLLTGTPLQNSIMELWSLFHFLLPFASAFSSNEEFREWFSNPMEDMVTGRTFFNEEIVRRLQSLLRPFMLRRLKKDVEAQLPSKTEKVVMCRLSRRQRLLYDDYMQLTETRERIRGGAGGVLGVLLALRKVCNHPDMFEERRTLSPVALDCLSEITLLVPRDILLQDNDFRGCYRFQKWRLCIEDVSMSVKYDKEMVFDDTWLDCLGLRLLWNDQAFECPLSRYSPENFRWPENVPAEQVFGADIKDSMSDTMWSMLCQQVEERQAWVRQRHQTTATLQAQRCRGIETSMHVWYPRSLEIVSHGRPGFLPSWLHPNVSQRVCAILPIAEKTAVYVPRVAAVHPPRLHCRLPVVHYRAFCSHTRESLAPLLALGVSSSNGHARRGVFDASSFLSELWPLHVRRCFSFPDKRLLIHDCGKLQFLQHALKQLRREGHRMLIFTQFVHMLNILERFLAIIGIPYLRIDGSTQAERRQAFVDRFNEDDRITCMILSTRSGGIGLNLTGADTVIFYDSDWNPTMDLQAQDRCHRIGQTKPVTIYRLISEHTVEENILQRARERKKLNNVVIRGGQFHAMASVDETYEDSAAALAALSDPVRLRSFFHDLDEDATIVADEQQRGEAHASKTDMGEPVDIREEMMRLEDQEDREAQQNVEEELRELEEQRRNDEAELGDEEEEDEEYEDDDVEEEGGGRSRRRKRKRELTGAELEEGLMDVSADDNALDAKNADMSRGVLPMVIQRRRDILRRQRTPLDRLLSVRFGTCHAADARKRYDALCENYATRVGEGELPAFKTKFRL
ncbi:putative DNA excision repair protein [Trypanosoma cruzi]|uniref:Putative DNA excision repair protein n=1 Tax=Trypanosoma cruzi TaxID=5693 RepID=A0A2V2WG93_TRYCR|nr:putative DNA excision repair protein [Trypanosoma cruzi]